MRWTRALLSALLLTGLPLDAQDLGKTKVLKDAGGRVAVTVPEKWAEKNVTGTNLVRAIAPGSSGGHDLMIVLEPSQSDVDAQRDRYIAYDSGRFAGAEVKKFTKPFFGYRLNAPDSDRVLVRGFISIGGDGLVLSVQSRFRFYDKFYATKVLAILSSVRASAGGGAEPTAIATGPLRRLFDRTASVSIAAPGKWKVRTDEDESVLLRLALHGRDNEPQLRLIDRGGPTNANLVISGISREWRSSYGGITIKKLRGRPPRMMVTLRKRGWIDYVIGFDAGGHGYALHLQVREGGFERYRAAADEIARSLVFAAGPYAVSDRLPGDISKEVRAWAVVHSAAEETTAADRVAGLVPGFFTAWQRVGPGVTRKAPPIQLVLVDEDVFAEVSDLFGDKPAAYNPARCAVICVKPPARDKKAARASWTGQLYGALAEAALHRDLGGKAPPWLVSGLRACMDAAGRTDGKPRTPHPTLAREMLNLVAANTVPSPKELFAKGRAEFVLAETLESAALAYGYVHLMLYGKGPLPGFYRKWVKLLVKAPRSAPGFDLKKYANGAADLKKHSKKNFAR